MISVEQIFFLWENVECHFCLRKNLIWNVCLKQLVEYYCSRRNFFAENFFLEDILTTNVSVMKFRYRKIHDQVFPQELYILLANLKYQIKNLI